MRIEKLCLEAEVSCAWQPFLLGPIFEKRGWSSSPFVLDPEKGRYMWRDVEREAERLGLPFKRPALFPADSVLSARLALVGLDEPWGLPFAKAVFQAEFVFGQDIGLPATLYALLEDLGQDGPAIHEAALSPFWKPRLRAVTQTALARGIFGAPTFFVEDEVFWGNDRLEQAVAWAKAKKKAP